MQKRWLIVSLLFLVAIISGCQQYFGQEARGANVGGQVQAADTALLQMMDEDGDGVIGQGDYDKFSLAFQSGQYDAGYDYDANGAVDENDFFLFQQYWDYDVVTGLPRVTITPPIQTTATTTPEKKEILKTQWGILGACLEPKYQAYPLDFDCSESAIKNAADKHCATLGKNSASTYVTTQTKGGRICMYGSARVGLGCQDWGATYEFKVFSSITCANQQVTSAPRVPRIDNKPIHSCLIVQDSDQCDVASKKKVADEYCKLQGQGLISQSYTESSEDTQDTKEDVYFVSFPGKKDCQGCFPIFTSIQCGKPSSVQTTIPTTTPTTLPKVLPKIDGQLVASCYYATDGDMAGLKHCNEFGRKLAAHMYCKLTKGEGYISSKHTFDYVSKASSLYLPSKEVCPSCNTFTSIDCVQGVDARIDAPKVSGLLVDTCFSGQLITDWLDCSRTQDAADAYCSLVKDKNSKAISYKVWSGDEGEGYYMIGSAGSDAKGNVLVKMGSGALEVGGTILLPRQQANKLNDQYFTSITCS